SNHSVANLWQPNDCVKRLRVERTTCGKVKIGFVPSMVSTPLPMSRRWRVRWTPRAGRPARGQADDGVDLARRDEPATRWGPTNRPRGVLRPSPLETKEAT